MAGAKPRSHLLEIKNEQRGVDGHIKDAGGERKPGFLKAPEIAETAAYPSVIAAFLRKGAGKFADHESRRQAPKDGKKEQDQDSMAVAGAVNNLFRPVSAARNHEKGSGNQRPKRELRRFLYGCWDCAGRKVGGNRYATQFVPLSS